jgi:hypothetical protein
MHGIIFVELKKYVDAKLGPDAWGRLLDTAGMRGRLFMPVEEYPDADAARLVSTASQMTGLAADAILQDFGEFITPDLLRMYGALLDRKWKTLDVIANTEETIHRVVRARNPGAQPPQLRCERNGNELTIVYTSGRRMCGVAKGIVRGLARHFAEQVDLRETACMLKGAPACRIVVAAAPAGRPA